MGEIDERRERLELVRECEGATEIRMRRLRRRDATAILSGMTCSLIATGLAGVPGLTGTLVLDGWQLTCAVTAVLAGAATLIAGLEQALGGTARMVAAATLLARLRALEVGLAMGRMSITDSDTEWAMLLREFPQLLPSATVQRLEVMLAN